MRGSRLFIYINLRWSLKTINCKWIYGCICFVGYSILTLIYFQGGKIDINTSRSQQPIPIYYLSLFKAPVIVYKIIEKKMRKFLWEGSYDKGGSHLVPPNANSSAPNPHGSNIIKLEHSIGNWEMVLIHYFGSINGLVEILSTNPFLSVKDGWDVDHNSWNPNFKRPLLDRNCD